MFKLIYQQAFDLAVSGKKVKRESWPAGQYLVARGGRLIIEGDPAWDKKEPNYYRQNPVVTEGQPDKPNEDKEAKDWVIFEDEIEASQPQTSTIPTAKYKNNTKPGKSE